jgi:hypothetical protein
MSRIQEAGRLVLLGVLLAKPALAQEAQDVCGG